MLISGLGLGLLSIRRNKSWLLLFSWLWIWTGILIALTGHYPCTAQTQSEYSQRFTHGENVSQMSVLDAPQSESILEWNGSAETFSSLRQKGPGAMRIESAVLALSMLFSGLAIGQSASSEITNSDVISMTKAGIGEHTIILAIKRGPVKFDTSPQALIALKHAGVSDQVLNAILSAPSEASPETKSSPTFKIGEISDLSERLAFERAIALTDPIAKAASLETFLQAYPQSVAKAIVVEMLAEIKREAATNTFPLQTPNPITIQNAPQTTPQSEKAAGIGGAPGDTARAASYRSDCNNGNMDACANLATYYRMGWGVSKDSPQAKALIKKACDGGSASGCQLQENWGWASEQNGISTENASQGLTLKVMQEQSVPYTQESGGGISTSCNIVGTANTSAYVSAYGNSAYGNARTNSNQQMTCNSYDTTISWPHILNVMFVEASDGNSYIIACDRAWAWSKCVPLRAGDTFNARFTEKGIQVEAINTKGKEENPTYNILQSKSLR
jgi:TPR repeat protein